MATTILPSSPSPVTRQYSAVAPPANTPCVLATFAVADHPGRCVALIEDEFSHTREHGRAYRYAVVCMVGEVETSYTGTDSLRDAQALVWHLTTPLPPVDEDGIPFLPSESDSLWWAQHSHESESELDAFLDSLAPDNYETMGDESEGGVR